MLNLFLFADIYLLNFNLVLMQEKSLFDDAAFGDLELCNKKNFDVMESNSNKNLLPNRLLADTEASVRRKNEIANSCNNLDASKIISKSGRTLSHEKCFVLLLALTASRVIL